MLRKLSVYIDIKTVHTCMLFVFLEKIFMASLRLKDANDDCVSLTYLEVSYNILYQHLVLCNYEKM